MECKRCDSDSFWHSPLHRGSPPFAMGPVSCVYILFPSNNPIPLKQSHDFPKSLTPFFHPTPKINLNASI
jgi:hypothetical protein